MMESNNNNPNPNPSRTRTYALTFRQLLLGLGLVIVVSGAVGLALGLALSGGNGKQTTSSSSQSGVGAGAGVGSISGGPGVAGAGAGAGAGVGGTSDPYASLTPREVLQKYLDAYSRGDWVTCNALLSPNSRAGLASPDELKFRAEEQTRKEGPLTIGQVGEFEGSNTGAQILFAVEWSRDDAKALYTPVRGVGLGGPNNPTSTPDAGATATARANRKPNTSTFRLERINGAWKINQYVPF